MQQARVCFRPLFFRACRRWEAPAPPDARGSFGVPQSAPNLHAQRRLKLPTTRFFPASRRRRVRPALSLPPAANASLPSPTKSPKTRIRTLPKTPSRSTRRHDLKQGRCVMGQHCENDHHAAAALSPSDCLAKSRMKDGVCLPGRTVEEHCRITGAVAARLCSALSPARSAFFPSTAI